MNINDRYPRLIFYPVVVFVFSVLLMPVFIVVLTSFTTKSAPTIPRSGWTLEWYFSLFNNIQMTQSLFNSVLVAVLSSIVAGIVGSITAFGFVNSKFRYKDEVSTFLLLPLMISPVITGLAILQYGGSVGLSRGFPVLLLAHSVLAFPFVFIIIRARLLTFDERLKDASRILGASNMETTVNITLPILAPSIVAGMLIAFIISFGEFTATQFLVTPSFSTAPVIIFNMLETGVTPEISALASLLVLFFVLIGVVSEYFS